MKFAFPIKLHSGLNSIITQEYGNKNMVEWYKANGVDINEHNGTDIILSGHTSKTYGSELICPFPKGKVVKTWFDNPMSTKGNGTLIQSEPFEEDGIQKIVQFLLWHCSEIVTSKIDFVEGETIAYVGNSGLVRPAPRPDCAYCGSHLHLGMFEYHFIDGVWIQRDADNGLSGALNPMERIDISKIYYGDDTGFDKDLAPAVWSLESILGKVKDWYSILKGR